MDRSLTPVRTSRASSPPLTPTAQSTPSRTTLSVRRSSRSRTPKRPHTPPPDVRRPHPPATKSPAVRTPRTQRTVTKTSKAASAQGSGKVLEFKAPEPVPVCGKCQEQGSGPRVLCFACHASLHVSCASDAGQRPVFYCETCMTSADEMKAKVQRSTQAPSSIKSMKKADILPLAKWIGVWEDGLTPDALKTAVLTFFQQAKVTQILACHFPCGFSRDIPTFVLNTLPSQLLLASGDVVHSLALFWFNSSRGFFTKHSTHEIHCLFDFIYPGVVSIDCC